MAKGKNIARGTPGADAALQLSAAAASTRSATARREEEQTPTPATEQPGTTQPPSVQVLSSQYIPATYPPASSSPSQTLDHRDGPPSAQPLGTPSLPPRPEGYWVQSQELEEFRRWRAELEAKQGPRAAPASAASSATLQPPPPQLHRAASHQSFGAAPQAGQPSQPSADHLRQTLRSDPFLSGFAPPQTGGVPQNPYAVTPGFQQPPGAFHHPSYLQPGFQMPGIPQPGVPQPGYQQAAMPPFWAVVDPAAFSFPGIQTPPITDPQIVSLCSLLPSVVARVMKKILDGTYTPWDLLLLLPVELRGKAKQLAKDDFLDTAQLNRDPTDFSMVHLIPALSNYGAILIYFAPAAVKSALAVTYFSYVSRLVAWADKYYLRAVLLFHVHFHQDILARKMAYSPEAWREEAGNLVASYIYPAIRPAGAYESRKRARPAESSGTSGRQAPETGSKGGSSSGDKPCFHWNLGLQCKSSPCRFKHVCTHSGCGKAHRAGEHNVRSKTE